MEFTVAVASTFVSAAIQFLIGARLLVLAARTRAMPETLIGFMLFLIGTGKFMELAFEAVLGPQVFIADLIVYSQYATSHLLLYIIFWRVFHPRTIWAAALCGLAASVLVAGFILESANGWHHTVFGWKIWFNKLRLHVAAVAFAWGATECFLHFGRLRRQLRLHLTTASVVIRILLWGISMASTLLLFLLVFLQIELDLLPALLVQIAWPCLNLISGLCLWFSFLPPKALRRIFDRMVIGAIDGESNG